MEVILAILTLIVTVLIAVFTAQSSRITQVQKQSVDDKDAMRAMIIASNETINSLRHEMSSHYVTYERLKDTLQLSLGPLQMTLERIEGDIQKLMKVQDAVSKISAKMELKQ